jgi:hypothetical protein
MKRIVTLALAAAGVVALTGGTATAGTVGPLARASGHSPYPAGCENPADIGTAHRGGEVEPSVAADPGDPLHLISVWQQDRWDNGGANGLFGKVSFDGGRSWRQMRPPPFSFCAGGTAANGGGYARASDPWVSFAPNGTAYFMALAVDFQQNVTAMTVARSRDGGLTWGPITTLVRDNQDEFFNDKNSITADPTDSRFAYAVWDRLTADGRGPTFFARTSDGGRTWEPAHAIFDPGVGFQTIGNQIQVLPDGTLLNLMTIADNEGLCADPDDCGGDPDGAAPDAAAPDAVRPAADVSPLQLAVIRSTDHGATWSAPVRVADNLAVGSFDPRDHAFVRDGSGLIAEIATDHRRGHRDAYVTWQDARFGGGVRDGIVLSASHDGGRTWGAPTRVSPAASGQAFIPQVTVNAFGVVGVSYYDFTNDTVAGIPLDTDFWLATSANGGRTFGPRQRVTPRSFDLRQATLTGAFFVGDYTGLASAGPLFMPVFGVANDGTDPDNLTDIVSARVVAGPVG